MSCDYICFMKAKTIFETAIELPPRKNCRIDNIYYKGTNWACLVDYYNNVTYHVKSGVHSLTEVYSDFKYCALNECPIDNLSFFPLFLTNEFKEIEGVKYNHY